MRLLAVVLLLAIALRNSRGRVCDEMVKLFNPRMDIFWVNLERSIERKLFMQTHLTYYGMDPKNRVNAFTADRIFVPDELALPAECVSFANQSIPNFPGLDSESNGTKAMLLSHCGRKKNRKREIAVTVSHLNTIRQAIYHGNASNPYALILEDDLQFATGIDFAALIASAPAGFGVLQLITSNDYAVLELWRVYQRWV
jgi:GR25 family glycosyltransferase involved in LPS biosynthesis